jgi:hypothetical protein
MKKLMEVCALCIGAVIVTVVQEALGIKITSDKISHPILVYDLLILAWGGVVSYIARM